MGIVMEICYHTRGDVMSWGKAVYLNFLPDVIKDKKELEKKLGRKLTWEEYNKIIDKEMRELGVR